MTFEQLYSSSRANLYTVTATNGKRLLLECGVRWPLLQKALDYDLSSIDFCLLTHEHRDHSKSFYDVMKAGINIFSGAGTFDFLDVKNHRRARAIPAYAGITNKNFDCYAFPIIHDAAEPFGYIVREISTNEYLLFIPDSAFIKQRFNIPFSIIALECSYDIKILEHRVDTQDINETLAKRLLTSHMEKQTTMKYLAEFCNLYKCREIHLLHCSGDNLGKKETKKEFEKKFFISTIIK